MEDFMAWYNKGLALAKLGKYEEAIECFDKAIELNPNFAPAWNNKGVALAKLGKYEEAIKCYDKALEIDPNYYYAWNNKGVALAKLGRYEEAIKCYEKAIQINPNYVDAWYNLGLALSKLGRYEEAIKCFDKVLKLKPDYQSAKETKEIVEKKIKQIKDIELNIDKNNFKVNRWTKVTLTIKNISENKISNITIKLLGEEFKGKKLPKISNLEKEESKSYIIYIKPMELGELPLDFYIEYEINGEKASKIYSIDVIVEE